VISFRLTSRRRSHRRIYEDEVQSAGVLLAQEEPKEAFHSAFSHQTAAHVRSAVQGITTKVQCAIDADSQGRRSAGCTWSLQGSTSRKSCPSL